MRKLAAVFLEKRGLQIREKNFRCRSGEIDLIAQDERYLVFVEVKYRKNGSKWKFFCGGRDEKKQRIIEQSGRCFTWLYPWMYREFPPCRFDVSRELTDEKIHWIKNAFDFCR